MVSKIRKLEGDDFWVIYQSTTECLFEHLFNEREAAKAYLDIYEKYWDKGDITEMFDVELRIIGRSLCARDVTEAWEEIEKICPECKVPKDVCLHSKSGKEFIKKLKKYSEGI